MHSRCRPSIEFDYLMCYNRSLCIAVAPIPFRCIKLSSGPNRNSRAIVFHSIYFVLAWGYYQTFGDEINLVEPRFNSGWAKVLGIWNIEEALNEEGEKEIIKEGYSRKN